MQLLTYQNPKMLKGEIWGYMTFIMHLSPAITSGYQVCPKASNGCIKACLNTAGRGVMQPVKDARIARTKLFFEERHYFMQKLKIEIHNAIIHAKKKGFIPVFRLNGTSDICFEKIRVDNCRNIMERFSEVQFYDYTKILSRNNLPKNYHLTFSRSESNNLDCIAALAQNINLAVVFNGKIPEVFTVYGIECPVFNGDDSDLRFLDPKQHVIGLTAKGRARKDLSGFTIQLTEVNRNG